MVRAEFSNGGPARTLNTAWRGKVEPGGAGRGIARLGKAWQGLAGPGRVRLGIAGQGLARQGRLWAGGIAIETWHGEAWPGWARRG